MFGLIIKKVFVRLLSLSGLLSTKCISINNEPRLARPTLSEFQRNFLIIHLWLV